MISLKKTHANEFNVTRKIFQKLNQPNKNGNLSQKKYYLQNCIKLQQQLKQTESLKKIIYQKIKFNQRQWKIKYKNIGFKHSHSYYLMLITFVIYSFNQTFNYKCDEYWNNKDLIIQNSSIQA